MPRKKTGNLGKGKLLIRVFCEGESEQAYTEYLKKKFSDVAIIKYPKSPGLFEYANDIFKKDPQYRDNAEVTDEIWFFFDVEPGDVQVLEQRMKIVKRLRRLRTNPNIKVRFLMTKGCIEYWLMLHYKMYNPSIQTTSEKERVVKELLENEPSYRKGNCVSTAKIAEKYPAAINNSKMILTGLLEKGMPGLSDTDERNTWLCRCSFTFSTVHEAIEFLQSL